MFRFPIGFAASVLSVSLVGCYDIRGGTRGTGGADANAATDTHDAGEPDRSAFDAGTLDGSSPDGQTTEDAGTVDATTAFDALPADQPNPTDLDANLTMDLPAADVIDVACAADRRLCDGVCRDLASDPSNCGACGRVCAGGQMCSLGSCQSSCASGQSNCNGACINLGAPCVVGVGACARTGSTLCGAGPTAACSVTPGAPIAEVCDGIDNDCDGLTDEGFCRIVGVCYTNGQGNPANVCERCVVTSVNESGPTVWSDAPAGTNCSTPANGVCLGTACGCRNAQTNCSGVCVDLNASAVHCGGCGRACASGQDCVGGTCVAGCIAPTTRCGSDCVDTRTNLNHCGACGRACPAFANGTAVCLASMCSGVCTAGFANCDGNPTNGCESSLATNAANCGVCGNACAPPSASGFCSAGRCGVGTCLAGRADCDGDPANGCEADLNTSAANCGACDRICAPNGRCLAGSCVESCPSGQSQCGGTCLAPADTCSVGVGACRRTGTQACDSRIAKMVAGSNFTCALRSDGTVVCWGASQNRENIWPFPVRGLGSVVDIDAFGGRACALATDGIVRCWVPGPTPEPVAVDGLTDVTGIAVGGGHACARVRDGTVRCWGSNQFNQLGDGTNIDPTGPVAVRGLTDVVEIVAGNQHTCARLSDGGVRCWGWNASGELGDGTTEVRFGPVTVSGVTNAVEISAGDGLVCARLMNGSVRCWGGAVLGNGIIQTGGAGYNPGPATVSGLTNAVEISIGSGFACARRVDGTVRCWGENRAGQLGDGSGERQLSPVSVAGLSNAIKIVAGDSHACALLADGNVRCWGANDFGQLGSVVTLLRRSPSAVVGITAAAEIAVGGYHACARLNDGHARCWGYNDYGQLGNGSGRSSPVPVAVMNLDPVNEIVAGNYHSCARMNNGTVRCWGGLTLVHRCRI
jgi:alpha-tubulin suppressor-like RCC1 family protein